MSTLLGTPGERWPLARAVDALRDSARKAGVPGLIWIAGILYPSLIINLDLAQGALGLIERATEIKIPYAAGTGRIVLPLGKGLVVSFEKGFWWSTAFVFIWLAVGLIWYRMVVGLAKVSDPGDWASTESSSPEGMELPRRRTLRSVWRAGRKLGATALGMWLMLLGLLLGAMLFMVGPIVMLVRIMDMTELNPLVAGLIIPFLILLLTYAVILQVINQLALHSLAHNRRGVASALTHAWRLVRASPWSATRATLVDFVLFLSILLAVNVMEASLGRIFYSWILTTGEYALYGFAGVTRAGFWARAYRALGGLSAADQIPGLKPVTMR